MLSENFVSMFYAEMKIYQFWVNENSKKKKKKKKKKMLTRVIISRSIYAYNNFRYNLHFIILTIMH